MSAIGIARVPGRDLRQADTAAWPVLGDEIAQLVSRITCKIEAGDLGDGDRVLIRQLAVKAASHHDEEYEEGWVAGAAKVASSGLVEVPDSWAFRLGREVERRSWERTNGVAGEVARLAGSLTAKVEAGEIEAPELAEQVRQLAEKIDQAATAEEIIARVGDGYDRGVRAGQAALVETQDQLVDATGRCPVCEVPGGPAHGPDALYLGGYADGLAGRGPQDTAERYRSGYGDPEAQLRAAFRKFYDAGGGEQA